MKLSLRFLYQQRKINGVGTRFSPKIRLYEFRNVLNRRFSKPITSTKYVLPGYTNYFAVTFVFVLSQGRKLLEMD